MTIARFLIAASILLLVVACSTTVSPPRSVSIPPSWDYAQETVCEHSASAPPEYLGAIMSGTLKQRGDQGWELVELDKIEGSDRCYLLIFKRPGDSSN